MSSSSSFFIYDKVIFKPSGKVFTVCEPIEYSIKQDMRTLRQIITYTYNLRSGNHLMKDVPESDLEYCKDNVSNDDKIKQLEDRISALENIVANLDKK